MNIFRPKTPQFLQTSTVLVLWALLLAPAATASTDAPARGRSLSLRVLEQRLRSGGGTLKCGELSRCAGITRMMGFIIDRSRNDIVLVGKAVPGKPALFLEDFVVALRSAYLIYAHKTARGYEHASPTCSIDPLSSTMRKLKKIGAAILSRSNDKQLDELMEEWNTACRSPQRVTVSGVPFDTRFARIMVGADFSLKKLVDGAEEIDIPGFTSHADMVLQNYRTDYLAGRRPGASVSMVNRFWLSPGEAQFVESTGSLIIRKCSVRLLTEQEFVEKSGTRHKTLESDSLARAFANQMTGKYKMIANRIPIYKELDDLFRIVFLAEVMQFSNAFASAALNSTYLLKELSLPQSEVSPTVPGSPHFVEATVRRPTPEGTFVAHFRLPSCGGVNIKAEIVDSMILQDKNEEVKKIQEEVIAARPSEDSLSWDFNLEWPEEE